MILRESDSLEVISTSWEKGRPNKTWIGTIRSKLKKALNLIEKIALDWPEWEWYFI